MSIGNLGLLPMACWMSGTAMTTVSINTARLSPMWRPVASLIRAAPARVSQTWRMRPCPILVLTASTLDMSLLVI